MTPHEELIDIQPDHPLRQFLTEYFGLTPEEIAQTIVSYEEEVNSVVLTFDFGEGLQNTPARTAKLLKLLRVSGRN
jgi:hypothetical protein